MKVLKGLLLILAATIFSYLVTSFLIFIVCFAFGLEFSWLYALGIWAILALLEKVFNRRKK